MHLRNSLLLTLALLLLRPLAVNSQEKFEISVGITSQGVAQITTDWGGTGSYYYRINSLTALESETYISKFYPGCSVQFAYKLAESGFFKKMNLLGYAGFQSVGFREADVVTRYKGNMETAMRASFLVGLRYNHFQKTWFNMYSQFMIGTDVVNKCRYWDIVYDNFSNGQRVTAQFTYLGFNIKLGRRESKLSAVAELGYGSEYAANFIPLIPGIRTGLSYRF